MKCSIFFYCMVVLVGVSVSETAWSYSDTQIHDMVQGRLLDRHPTDTPQWWQSLGDNSVPVIIGMYTAENNTFHRIRLIQGLGWMDNQQAIDFIQQQTEQTNLDVLRNAGIRALARGQGAKEEDFIAKFLKNEDPQTRLAAAESLKEVGARDGRAKTLYDQYLKEEKTPWIVDKLNGKVGVVGGLRPVTSSEDRVSPEFEGTWRGYWVGAKTDSKGMQSAPVLLSLKTPAGSGNVTAIQGSLSVLKHEKVDHSFELSNASGRGVQLAGKFQETTQGKVNPNPLNMSFEGGLTRVGDTVLLEIRVPEKTSILVLKKD